VRAEKTRQEVHGAGRAPEFLAAPPEHVQLSLQASAALRAGRLDEVARLVTAAEEARPAVAGTCDGARFEDLRDLDDLVGGVFEILTSTGRCLWIPVESVASLEFDAPAQPLDLLWRPAAMAVKNGPEGKVFFPTVYCGASDGIDDAARLGRRTDWAPAGNGGAMRGIGLRTYLVGEEARTVLEVTRIAFDGAGA
jgi:type VI secretion system protein ImpE